ncbi:MAG TPA: thioesterase family protein [Myxococcota bacterium]|jgi:acyl-CoA thioester hydrolase|nr:thioesterase family protein [Myxococcota bacterium]
MTAAPRLHATSIEVEVPFHDVDALGVVWHGHYWKYLELARTRLLRALGLDAGDLIGPRYRFVVAETRCRHAFPLRYGERARVEAWLRDVRNRIHVAYEVTNLTHGRRAARAQTILVTLDAAGRLLLETPHEILARIGA